MDRDPITWRGACARVCPVIERAEKRSWWVPDGRAEAGGDCLGVAADWGVREEQHQGGR